MGPSLKRLGPTLILPDGAVSLGHSLRRRAVRRTAPARRMPADVPMNIRLSGPVLASGVSSPDGGSVVALSTGMGSDLSLIHI